VKKIDTLKAYIKFETKLVHLTWRKELKCKTSHGKSEKKCEFGSPWSESLGFKCNTPIMLGPPKQNRQNPTLKTKCKDYYLFLKS
jgi:hypothetical protein